MALIGAVLAAALSSVPAAADACGDGSTLEINACLGERLRRHEAELARYAAAARERLRQQSREASAGEASAKDALRWFDEAERAWWQYRDAECRAVYAYWSGGTIRGMKALRCKILLTQERQHTIWSEWLTYPDQTPPILPEPPPATFP